MLFYIFFCTFGAAIKIYFILCIGSHNREFLSPGSSRPFPSPAAWCQPSWFAFSLFDIVPLLLPSRYPLPWPLFFSPPFSIYSYIPPLHLSLPSFSPPLVSSSLLLSVCVTEGSAPITSYLERGSCSQSGFCLLLGQVISELQ